MESKSELPDHHTYSGVSFYPDTFRFYLEAVKFYEQLLSADLAALDKDPDLALILDEETRKSFKIHHEVRRVRRVREWIEAIIQERGEDAFDYEVPVSHGTIRFLKSVAQLYLKHLKQRRNELATRPNISRYVLEAVDGRVSQLEEKTGIGILATASPMPLLVDEVAHSESPQQPQPSSEKLVDAGCPRPIVISSIEILDLELRSRCLDLFEAFQTDGQRDRLDTVITEATRILENCIRALGRLPQDCVGGDLARAAFGGNSPVLSVSDIPAEQEAAHLLYRGAFGFIRNQAHHRLMGELQPERVVQVLAFIDYLLLLAESARKKDVGNDPGSGAGSRIA